MDECSAAGSSPRIGANDAARSQPCNWKTIQPSSIPLPLKITLSSSQAGRQGNCHRPESLFPVPRSLLYYILLRMAISRRRHVSQRQCGAFPQQSWRSLAGRVQALQMKCVFARAQTQRAAIVTHRVARRAANLRKRRAGFRHFHAVYHQARAVAREEVKGIAAIGGMSISPSHATA